MKCPICEKGKLKKGKIREVMFGVDLGEFPAEVCEECEESFTDIETTKRIEEEAKKRGIWGLEFVNLKEGEEAYIHPDSKGIRINRGI